MIHRLTIACGLLTLAIVVALVIQDHALFGARSSHRGAASVTAIPDKPSYWPPVKPEPPAPPPLKGRPPAPQPQPLHQAPAPHPAASAARSTVDTIIGIAQAVLNLPKSLDQTQVNPSH
jgi:hypothetical protein